MKTNLSRGKQNQRILRIFQLQKHENLPEVSPNTLENYFAFLTKNLLFPIHGTFDQEAGPLQNTTYPITIKHLVEDIDEFYGICIEGTAGKKHVELPLADFDCDSADHRNFQLINDYKTWFWNKR